MNKENLVQVEVLRSEDFNPARYDLNRSIFDINSNIDLLCSHVDTLDYMVSAASGLLCGILDVLWVGQFSLYEGRTFAKDEVDKFVQKTANMLGCKDSDVKSCVKFLEDRFPLVADGNTPDFGGGLQHHLRDFAHHPTIVGLCFSLLTQFTGRSYGTDVKGNFIVVDVPEKSKLFIGKDNASKIINGTVIWFFHLISDIAGSGNTAGLSGGTGIPGPILSLAKEMAAIPLFKGKEVKGESISVIISKLFNGTLLADRDENGKIIRDTVLKMDFRGELGVLAESGKQAIPVLANECIVRIFYCCRKFASEIKGKDIKCPGDLLNIDWQSIFPVNSPTLTRMLTIATGVFTTVDVAEAVIMQKYWVSINYVGVGRFAVAIGGEIAWALKRQDLVALKKMYEMIQQNTFSADDNRNYVRMERDMNTDKLGLTLEETEILYNIEYHKTQNDIDNVKLPVGSEKIKDLKKQWLEEWASYMKNGFAEFVQIKGAELHWYSINELKERIAKMNPSGTWYKLALLEAMLFEPYFTLSTETNIKGNEVPSKKYNALNAPLLGFNEQHGDKYLEETFSKEYCQKGFISRLRKCHSKALKELNEVLKTTLTAVSIGAGVIILAVITAGALAPEIAVALAGSNFAGLSGAALTNACLAYLGGGAIAMGGAGMAGGTAVIVGGGAILGIGAGAGAGGIAAAMGIGGKKAIIMQSAKLMVSVREIFLNDEKDIEYSSSVYEQYVASITEIEKGLVEMRLKADVAPKEEKKELKEKIKNAEDTANAMKIAMKQMNKFIGSYKVGLGIEK